MVDKAIYHDICYNHDKTLWFHVFSWNHLPQKKAQKKRSEKRSKKRVENGVGFGVVSDLPKCSVKFPNVGTYPGPQFYLVSEIWD